MFSLNKLSVLFLIIASVAILVRSKFLTQKPDFLIPCSLKDSEFNQCYRNNFQALFVEWKNGNAIKTSVPGLKSVGGLDPLYVKRVTIDQDLSSVSVNANLLNLEITGFGDVQIKDVQLDTSKWTGMNILLIPKFVIKSDYQLKGKILNLSLNGSGKMTLSADNFVVKIQLKYKPREESGFHFVDIDKLRLEIIDIGGLHIQFDNLFNGQKELEDSANILFNENWREFYEILRPAIRSAVETVMNDRLSKVFAYTPVDYLVGDIASAFN